jgi:hypothetical protein
LVAGGRRTGAGQQAMHNTSNQGTTRHVL